MGRKCKVAGCQKTVGLHNFPQDLVLRRQWLRVLGLGESCKLPPSSGICKRHFTRDSFENLMEFELGFTTKLYLRSEAVPTLRLLPRKLQTLLPRKPQTLLPRTPGDTVQFKPKRTREKSCQTDSIPSRHMCVQVEEESSRQSEGIQVSCDTGTFMEILLPEGASTSSFHPNDSSLNCSRSRKQFGNTEPQFSGVLVPAVSSFSLSPAGVLVPSVFSVPLTPAGVLVPAVFSCFRPELTESPQISKEPEEDLLQITLGVPQTKEEPEEHGIKQEEDLLHITLGVKAEENCLLQEIPQRPQTKEEPEEHGIKQEEDLQITVGVPQTKEEPEEVRIKHEEEPLCVFVNTEEWSLPQRQTEHREETQREDISPETEGDTEHSSDYDQDADLHLQPMSSETDDDGDDHHRVQSRATDGPHTGDKPFSCSVCDKAFSKNRYLTEHMRTHTGDKPFSCSVCDKAFSTKRYFKDHMRTHTGDKPFSCSVCDKAFSKKGNVREHMKTHTGEKLFSCSVCNRGFSLKRTLTFHMRTHTGHKPFSCSVCEKVFTLRNTLSRHMRTHTQGKNPSAVQSVPKPSH